MKALLELAIKIAKQAHFGQKYGNEDYFKYHVLPVALLARSLFSDSLNHLELMIVGILHDVIEDSDITSEDLIAQGFPNHIVVAVVLLTKLETVSRASYIAAINKNPLARAVKRADTLFNLGESIKGNSLKRIHKYSTQLAQLVKSNTFAELEDKLADANDLISRQSNYLNQTAQLVDRDGGEAIDWLLENHYAIQELANES